MKTVLRTLILCLVLVTMASVSNVVGQTDALDPESLDLTRGAPPDPDWIAQRDTLRTFWMSVPRYTSFADLAPIVYPTPSSQMDSITANLSSFPIIPGGGSFVGNVSYLMHPSAWASTSAYHPGMESGGGLIVPNSWQDYLQAHSRTMDLVNHLFSPGPALYWLNLPFLSIDYQMPSWFTYTPPVSLPTVYPAMSGFSYGSFVPERWDAPAARGLKAPELFPTRLAAPESD